MTPIAIGLTIIAITRNIIGTVLIRGVQIKYVGSPPHIFLFAQIQKRWYDWFRY